MSEFEKRIREMSLISPFISLRSAVQIADQGGDPIPFPEDPRDAEAGAYWASQYPEIMDLMLNSKYINAIREIRTLAPRDQHGRPLDLLAAKRIMEVLRDGRTE